MSRKFFSSVFNKAPNTLLSSNSITRGESRQVTPIHRDFSDHKGAISRNKFQLNMLKQKRAEVVDGKVIKTNNAFNETESRGKYLGVRIPAVVETLGNIAEQYPEINEYDLQEVVLPDDVETLVPFGEKLQSLHPERRYNFFMNDHGLALIVPDRFYIHAGLTTKIEKIKIGGKSMSEFCQVLTDGEKIKFHVHAPLAYKEEFITILSQLMFEHAVLNCLANNAPRKYSITGDLNSDFDATEKVLRDKWNAQCAKYLKENGKPLPCEFKAHGDISENGHLHNGKLITADAAWYFEFNPAKKPSATIHRRSMREVIALLVGSGFFFLENPAADEASMAAVLATASNNTSSLFYKRTEDVIEGVAAADNHKMFCSTV